MGISFWSNAVLSFPNGWLQRHLSINAFSIMDIISFFLQPTNLPLFNKYMLLNFHRPEPPSPCLFYQLCPSNHLLLTIASQDESNKSMIINTLKFIMVYFSFLSQSNSLCLSSSISCPSSFHLPTIDLLHLSILLWSYSWRTQRSTKAHISQSNWSISFPLFLTVLVCCIYSLFFILHSSILQVDKSKQRCRTWNTCYP